MATCRSVLGRRKPSPEFKFKKEGGRSDEAVSARAVSSRDQLNRTSMNVTSSMSRMAFEYRNSSSSTAFMSISLLG